MDQASHIWFDLKNRFSQGDRSCISDFQMEANTLNQGDLCAYDYFTKLRTLGMN